MQSFVNYFGEVNENKQPHGRGVIFRPNGMMGGGWIGWGMDRMGDGLSTLSMIRKVDCNFFDND